MDRATEGAHDRGSGSLLYWVLAYLALMEPSVERLEGAPITMLFWNVVEVVGGGSLEALEAKPTVCLLE